LNAPQAVAGLGPPPAEARIRLERAAGRRGAGAPAGRGAHPTWTRRRPSRGWGPAGRGCAGAASPASVLCPSTVPQGRDVPH